MGRENVLGRREPRVGGERRQLDKPRCVPGDMWADGTGVRGGASEGCERSRIERSVTSPRKQVEEEKDGIWISMETRLGGKASSVSSVGTSEDCWASTVGGGFQRKKGRTRETRRRAYAKAYG